MATILVTGAAGFIGASASEKLLARGERVIGIDNLNDYYDVSLKQARLARLTSYDDFIFRQLDISNRDDVLAMATEHPEISGIVHLAAQAGVRHSLVDPYSYITANVMGHVVILELARSLGALRHFVYASSSSVYGANLKQPFSETDPVEHPNSLYAATKRADELMSYTYAHLYGIAATGLRFFTVYGPWGRPDMAPILFARAIAAGEPIRIFNHGEMRRDFTYIDDIVNGVMRALDRPAAGTPPHALYNLGNSRPEKLTDFIATIENALQRKATLVMDEMQPGDVPTTYADIEAARRDLGYTPAMSMADGIPRFIAWFKDYYRV